MDIGDKIVMLQVVRDETPACCAVPSVPERHSKSSVMGIKEAKACQFPVEPLPAEVSAAAARLAAAKDAPKKKNSVPSRKTN